MTTSLDRKLALNVESWRREKQKQQQQQQRNAETADDPTDGGSSPDKKPSPSRTPRRSLRLPTSVVPPVPLTSPPTVAAQGQPSKGLSRIVIGGLPGSPPKGSPKRANPPSLISAGPLELAGTKGVKDFADESDIFEEIDVTLKNSVTGEVERTRLKIGETVQNIKKRIAAKSSVEYNEIDLVLAGKRMMDPLSLNDFPAIASSKKAEIEVVFRGKTPVASVNRGGEGLGGDGDDEKEKGESEEEEKFERDFEEEDDEGEIQVEVEEDLLQAGDPKSPKVRVGTPMKQLPPLPISVPAPATPSPRKVDEAGDVVVSLLERARRAHVDGLKALAEENRALRAEKDTLAKEVERLRHDPGSEQAKVTLKKLMDEASELRGKLAQAEAKIRELQEAIRARDARCSKAEQSLSQLRAKWKSLHVVLSSEPPIEDDGK